MARPCNTPDCTGEYAPEAIDHDLIYRSRTVLVRQVPAQICPDCGDTWIEEEVLIYLEEILQRRGNENREPMVFEIG